MPTYTYRHIEYHRVSIEWSESFDPTDQSRWTDLLNRAESNDIDTQGLSKEPPSDPVDWFELLSQLPNDEIARGPEQNWTVMSRNGHETSTILEDPEGEEIVRDGW